MEQCQCTKSCITRKWKIRINWHFGNKMFLVKNLQTYLKMVNVGLYNEKNLQNRGPSPCKITLWSWGSITRSHPNHFLWEYGTTAWQRQRPTLSTNDTVIIRKKIKHRSKDVSRSQLVTMEVMITQKMLTFLSLFLQKCIHTDETSQQGEVKTPQPAPHFRWAQGN